MHVVVKRGSGAESLAGLERLADLEGVRIIDRIDDGAALVEVDEAQIASLENALPGWSVAPERGIARPAPPFPRGRWKLGGD